MRQIAQTLVVIGLFLALAPFCQAGGDEVNAIIDKAIKAHGIKPKDDGTFAYRGKSKGTLHIQGLDLEFTQDVTLQIPGKFKDVMDLSVMGQQITVTTVFNGKEGWIKAGNMEKKVDKELLDELKEAAHAMELSQGLLLKDKSLKLSLLGEVKVKGKAAMGVQVSKKGYRDMSFYFDKATGMIVKVERQTLDAMTGQLVNEERFITEYQEVEGRKIAKKVEALRDGKPFMEAEIVEARMVDRIDDSEFRKPD